VLDCVEAAVRLLDGDQPPGEDPEGIVAEVVRPNAFDEEAVAGWEDDPVAACERVFPGSRRLVEKYAIDVARTPVVTSTAALSNALGCTPSRHFGTFLAELQRLDDEGGETAVRAVSCPY
jgi:hypothetical protein